MKTDLIERLREMHLADVFGPHVERIRRGWPEAAPAIERAVLALDDALGPDRMYCSRVFKLRDLVEHHGWPEEINVASGFGDQGAFYWVRFTLAFIRFEVHDLTWGDVDELQPGPSHDVLVRVKGITPRDDDATSGRAPR